MSEKDTMTKIDPKYVQAIVAVRWPAWEPGKEAGEWILSSWDGSTESLYIKLFDAGSWRKYHMLVLPEDIEEAYIVKTDTLGPVNELGWLLVTAFVDPIVFRKIYYGQTDTELRDSVREMIHWRSLYKAAKNRANITQEWLDAHRQLETEHGWEDLARLMEILGEIEEKRD